MAERTDLRHRIAAQRAEREARAGTTQAPERVHPAGGVLRYERQREVGDVAGVRAGADAEALGADRVGVALMIDALRHFSQHPPSNTLYGVATVMEEVGTRGAKTSAEVVNPDVAIVLESDICGDVPGIRPEESSVKLGGGPALVLVDARMIPNLRLRDLVIETAKALDIPLQFSAITGGATDGAMIHLHGAGVPTVVLGVPARHIHSHSAIIHRDDYERALRLLIGVIERLDEKTVRELTE